MGVNTSKLVGYVLLDGGLTISQVVSGASLGLGPRDQAVDKLRAASLVERDPRYSATTKVVAYSLRQEPDPIVGGKLAGQALVGVSDNRAMADAKIVAYTLYTDLIAPIQAATLLAQSQGGVDPTHLDLDKLLVLTQSAVAPRAAAIDKATAYALLDDADDETAAAPMMARRFSTLLVLADPAPDAPPVPSGQITLRGRSTTRGTVTYRLTHRETPPPDRIALETNPPIRLEDGSYFLNEAQSIALYNGPDDV